MIPPLLAAVLAYLALACPSIGPLTLPANPGYVSADELALSVGTSPVFSLLALVSTAYTYGYGLNEVWLPGSSAKNAEYVFPSKVRARHTTPSPQRSCRCTACAGHRGTGHREPEQRKGVAQRGRGAHSGGRGVRLCHALG